MSIYGWMGTENMCTNSGLVFSLNKDINSTLLDNVNVTYGHNAKWNLTERQRSHESTYINFENN